MNKKITIKYKKIVFLVLLILTCLSFISIIPISNNSNSLNYGTNSKNKTTKQSLKDLNFEYKIYADNNSYTTFYFSETGSIYAWGYNGEGQYGIGNTYNHYEPVRVDSYWNIFFDTTKITSFVNSLGMIYAFLDDGSIYAWGNNYLGIDIIGEQNEYISSPVRVDTVWNQYFDTTLIVDIQTTFFTTFVFLNDGSIYGWGDNSNGQLGLGNTEVYKVPTRLDIVWNLQFDVFSIIDFTIMNSGTIYATLNNGLIYGWGRNDWGELGIDVSYNILTPTRIDTYWGAYFNTSNIENIYTLNSGTVIVFLNNGEIWGWGQDLGALGIGSSNIFPKDHTRLDQEWNNYFNTSQIEKFYVTTFNVFAFLDNGEIWGWGMDLFGSLGYESNNIFEVWSPTNLTNSWNDVFDTSKIKNFYTLPSSTYAILDNGSIYVWGNNEEGQLGFDIIIGEDAYTSTPTSVYKFSNLDSEWVNGNLNVWFYYDKDYWGTDDLYYTIYSDDINNPIISSTQITNLNLDGGITGIPLITTSPGKYYIQITSEFNNEGILVYKGVLNPPTISFTQNVEVFNISTISANIKYEYYSGDNGNGQIQYSLDGGNNWTIISQTAEDGYNNFFTLTNLNYDTSYNVLVAPTMNTTNLSYTSFVTFRTATPSKITNVYDSNVTSTSATINYHFEAGNSATGYIMYRINFDEPWQRVKVTNLNDMNSFRITGLNPDDSYNVTLYPENEGLEFSATITIHTPF